MTGEWFDAGVAALARTRSRRAWIAAMAPAALGAILGQAIPQGGDHASAAQQCRGKRSKCKRNGHCCSGRCRKRKSKNKGRCRCSRYLEPCRKDGDCCPFEVSLVCASGRCQT